ncbi:MULTISPECIES: hypothetical protein [Metallosphaera]|uniref:hypothetical protein n=1 Tax=Metallosphaera TaxID=41980 RepID=UPI001F051093|nr:hypothetical protein [Metallosphaera sedula]MCH1772192.1 hypothetical protein [Metallosphaera sedula]MCP6727738.1 hypothetical protein [Metallosphaera sedula]
MEPKCKIIHVSAVGTSLLRNYEKGHRDVIQQYGLEGWYSLSFNDTKQKIIERNFQNLKEKLVEYMNKEGPRRLRS